MIHSLDSTVTFLNLKCFEMNSLELTLRFTHMQLSLRSQSKETLHQRVWIHIPEWSTGVSSIFWPLIMLFIVIKQFAFWFKPRNSMLRRWFARQNSSMKELEQFEQSFTYEISLNSSFFQNDVSRILLGGTGSSTTSSSQDSWIRSSEFENLNANCLKNTNILLSDIPVAPAE